MSIGHPRAGEEVLPEGKEEGTGNVYKGKLVGPVSIGRPRAGEEELPEGKEEGTRKVC